MSALYETFVDTQAAGPHQTRAKSAQPGLFTRIALIWLGRMALRRQERQLAALEPHLLDDIGVSAEQARGRQAAPAWDAPDHWLR